MKTSKTIRLCFSIAALLISNKLYASVVLDINASGQLLGAQNVSVGNQLFDVQFENGSCVLLFSGCDSIDDFVFTSIADARAASQSLLDQVLLDLPSGQFDSNSSLANGCIGGTGSCRIMTPYTPIRNADGTLPVATLLNSSATPGLIQLDFVLFPADNIAPAQHTAYLSTNRTYAIWTPATAVPLPSSILLFGSAIAGLAASLKRLQAEQNATK